MISVIISIYKHLDRLELVLQGLASQSFKDFEVIVSEDDDAQETIAYIDQARKKFPFPIQHVSQIDEGFRKVRVQNESVRRAVGEKIVFLDGDCIPHKHLLKNYDRLIDSETMACGRRVMLPEKFNYKKKITFFSALFSGASPMSRGLYLPFIHFVQDRYGILGCNFGIQKQTLYKVNGFDEEYPVIGIAEDVDIEWRLKKIGIRPKKVTMCCITYHMYHKVRHDDEIVAPNYKMLSEKKAIGETFCVNGLVKE